MESEQALEGMSLLLTGFHDGGRVFNRKSASICPPLTLLKSKKLVGAGRRKALEHCQKGLLATK